MIEKIIQIKKTLPVKGNLFSILLFQLNRSIQSSTHYNLKIKKCKKKFILL